MVSAYRLAVLGSVSLHPCIPKGCIRPAGPTSLQMDRIPIEAHQGIRGPCFATGLVIPKAVEYRRHLGAEQAKATEST